MKCPHCGTAFSSQWSETGLRRRDQQSCGPDPDAHAWAVVWDQCAECFRFIVKLRRINVGEEAKAPDGQILSQEEIIDEWQVYPKGAVRPCPDEVPEELRGDYLEACLVLTDSPKASAALSRRCLQRVLRTKAEVKIGTLFSEINQVLESNTLPSHVAEVLHASREIGNLAAHATESADSGEILDVEPGEAEWNIETLEVLFDFYFVQPARTSQRLAALTAKLAAAGKTLHKRV